MDSTDSHNPGTQPETPFHDLEHYLSVPRVGGLTLSPDGKRLVTTVATLNGKGTEYVTALWELDPAGEKQARRITQECQGRGGRRLRSQRRPLLHVRTPRPGDPR